MFTILNSLTMSTYALSIPPQTNSNGPKSQAASHPVTAAAVPADQSPSTVLKGVQSVSRRDT